MADFQTMGN